LLVVVALLLNTVIYTENEAARESAAPEVSELLRSQQTAIDLVRTVIADENAGGDREYSEMEANVTRRLDAWSALSTRHAAVTTRTVGLELRDVTFGTRVVQDVDESLENAYGAEDWTLVSDVTDVRQFELTIDRVSLVDVGDNDTNATVLAVQDAFSIVVTDTSTRQAFVYRDGSNIVIGIADSSGDITGRCRTTEPTANIALVTETLGGQHCPALQDFLDLASPADIEFRNGANAVGSYVAVVDEPALDEDLFAPYFSDTPRAERIIYEVAVSYHISGQRVTYDVRIDGLAGDGR
jgi:hypothetical protein